MKRPDLDTLACVNPACHLLRRPGEGHRTVRKVSGHDRLRLLRCRPCGGACAERRDRALCHPTLPEAPATEVSSQLEEGWSVRATARLVQVAQATSARLVRVAGRHAQRCHAQPVHDLTPQALEGDEPWRGVQKSRSGARPTRRRRRATWGIIRRALRTARWASLWGGQTHARADPGRGA